MDILLLEDDIDLGQAVCDHLEANQHQVNWMKLCEQTMRALGDKRVALCLFDLRLPDGDALDVLRAMRSRGDTRPVILLTAQDQVSDRIRGLQAGADDYIVKPFDLDELLARIDAVSRRSGSISPHALRTGDLLLDFEAKTAWRGSEALSLTAMEWTLLRCLTTQIGRIWSRADLLAAAHPHGHDEAESNSLEVIISRLRRKLGAERISTHRGLGYRFESPD